MATNISFDGALYEIFSWLPTISLYRFSTVAKPCLGYLSEDPFVEKQCVNSCKKIDESLIIQNDSCLRIMDDKMQICFLPENISCKGVPQNFLDFLATKSRVLASSNGLILCVTVGNTNKSPMLFLCNPMTQTFLPIKDLERSYQQNGEMKVAFVCGKSFSKKNYKFPLDYTLLMFETHDCNEWDSGYDVYILEEGIWVLKKENLPTGGRNLNFEDQVFCNNGLYIPSDYGCYFKEESPHYWPYILQYNIEDGNSSILALPHDAREFFYAYTYNFRVFGWEREGDNALFKSICLVKHYEKLITIWVLKTETKNSSSSWKLLMSINIVDDLGIKDTTSWTNSFTILGKNLIFANGEGDIYRYYLEGKHFGKLEMIYKYGYIGSHRLRFNSFSTTLRPCVKDLVNQPLKFK